MRALSSIQLYNVPIDVHKTHKMAVDIVDWSRSTGLIRNTVLSSLNVNLFDLVPSTEQITTLSRRQIHSSSVIPEKEKKKIKFREQETYKTIRYLASNESGVKVIVSRLFKIEWTFQQTKVSNKTNSSTFTNHCNSSACISFQQSQSLTPLSEPFFLLPIDCSIQNTPFTFACPSLASFSSSFCFAATIAGLS